MRISWIKGAVTLSTVVMIAGVSVPVGVSASVATQNQQTQSTKVSQKQIDQLNQQVDSLSAGSIKKRINGMSNAQLKKLSAKSTKQVKQELTDPKIAKAVKSVDLSDVEAAATDSNVSQLKKTWTTKAANQLQSKLAHSKNLTAAEKAQVQKTNLAQDIQQVTPAQIKSTLGQLSETQWENLIQNALTTTNQGVKSVKAPTATQIRKQTQGLTAGQVDTAKQNLQATTSNTDDSYYTDILNNPNQLTTKSNVATSLLGLLLPVASLAVKLTIGPVVGFSVSQVLYAFLGVVKAVFMTVIRTVLTIASIVIPPLVGLVPIFGPIYFVVAVIFTQAGKAAELLDFSLIGSVVRIIGSILGGVVSGTAAMLLAPILPPVLTPPFVTLSRRLDQEITYADSLKSGHQYTQAINVKAGHSYRVSFKADQASNPETNDPVTNFGSLTYGLVADKTAAIGNSDVSDIVDNVQNGSATITSRAKTNYVMTFDAKQNGTIYLVADTADATINSGIKQSQYATTPLWYVNTAVDMTLN